MIFRIYSQIFINNKITKQFISIKKTNKSNYYLQSSAGEAGHARGFNRALNKKHRDAFPVFE